MRIFPKVIYILSALICMGGVSSGSGLPQGTYVGWKTLPDLTPDIPGDSWFHQHTLTIKGRNITIEADPHVIEDGKVLSSSSDGGFYTFKGELHERDGAFRATMRVVKADYVGVPKDGWPELDLEIINLSPIGFTLDGVAYTLIPDGWITLQIYHHKQQKQEGEQGGTGQPTTRPESKSEGSDKPQPEAEGRSR